MSTLTKKLITEIPNKKYNKLYLSIQFLDIKFLIIGCINFQLFIRLEVKIIIIPFVCIVVAIDKYKMLLIIAVRFH